MSRATISERLEALENVALPPVPGVVIHVGLGSTKELARAERERRKGPIPANAAVMYTFTVDASVPEPA